MSMAENYVTSLSQAYNLNIQERQMLMDEAVNEATITGSYNGSPTLALLNYMENVSSRLAENERSDAYLTLAQEAAAEKGFEIQVIGNDYYEYDPAQGFEASAVKIGSKPVTGTGTEAYIAPAGQSVWDSVIDATGGDITTIANRTDAAGNLLYTDSQVKEIANRINERYQYNLAYQGGTDAGRYEEVAAPGAVTNTDPESTQDFSLSNTFSPSSIYSNLQSGVSSLADVLSRSSITNPYR